MKTGMIFSLLKLLKSTIVLLHGLGTCTYAKVKHVPKDNVNNERCSRARNKNETQINFSNESIFLVLPAL